MKRGRNRIVFYGPVEQLIYIQIDLKTMNLFNIYEIIMLATHNVHLCDLLLAATFELVTVSSSFVFRSNTINTPISHVDSY